MKIVDNFRAILASLEDDAYRWNGQAPLKTPVFVTYSFYDGSDLPDPDSLYYHADHTRPLSSWQKDGFRGALDEFEEVTGLIFVETTGPAMIRALGVEGSNWAGWSGYPYSDAGWTGSLDLVLDVTGNGDQWDRWLRLTALHEIGHAVGLSHPFEGALQLSDRLDVKTETLMSYTWPRDGTTVRGLGPIDLDALDHLYGPAVDTDGWSWSVGPKVFRATGNEGANTLVGVSLENRLKGAGGNDILIGGLSADRLNGGAGDDVLFGRQDADVLRGGSGDDRLWAAYRKAGVFDSEANTLLGQKGRDLLVGSDGDDRLAGGNGKDRLRGGNGDDWLNGGRNADRIAGGTGADRALGGDGNDRILGGDGDDELLGGAGRDILFGQQGSDRLEGGAGADRMTGGAASDVFVFGSDAKKAVDRITDFELSRDWLDVSGSGVDIGTARFLARGGGSDTLVKLDAGALRILLLDVAQAEVAALDPGDLFLTAMA